jgi:hypothetical protein
MLLILHPMLELLVRMWGILGHSTSDAQTDRHRQ